MRTDIVTELEALSEHYPKPRRDASSQARWLADYVADLNRFTPMEIRTACAKWRSAEPARFPTPGQLAAICERSQERAPAINGPWRLLTDDELNALTVREAERYHRIAAQQVVTSQFGKIASRIGSRDRVVLEEDEDYRRMVAEEAFHLGESRRLRGVLAKRRA